MLSWLFNLLNQMHHLQRSLDRLPFLTYYILSAPHQIQMPINAKLIHFIYLLSDAFTMTMLTMKSAGKQFFFHFFSAWVARVKVNCGLLHISSETSVWLILSVFIDLQDRASSEVVFGHKPAGVERYWCGSLHQDHWLCAPGTDFPGSGKK